MGGVSGAFLILPFQVSVLGFTSPAVSSTNQLYNIFAIPGGLLRYFREGRLVMPLAWIVIFGTLPGVFIGAILRIEFLPDPTNFKFFAGLVLSYMGVRLLLDIITKRKANGGSEARFEELVKNNRDSGESNSNLPKTKVIQFNLKSVIYEFYGERFEIPTLKVSLVSFIVGIAGGIYGIGGGAIMAPFFVAFFNLPVYTVAGAALMGTFVTSISGVAFYQFLSYFYPGQNISPDWLLGLFFGIGGLAGMYLGAKFQKYFPAKIIKIILVCCIMFISFKYIIDYFIK
jgi:uncharacterized membrane protein YfcA